MLEPLEDVIVVGDACDGEEAIRLIEEKRPDLVFLDIQMPGLSGLEVAASLEPPRPKVVFCTAYDQYAVEAFEHHAVDYLLKPLKRERLTKSLDKLRRSQDERHRYHREIADASETQARLFPQTLPRMDSLEYSGGCRAARGVGGDYYDFLPIGDGGLAIVVGDVSGKGLYAGLLMASLQARLQSLAPLHGASLERLFSEINRLLHSSTESNRYATLFYGLYDDTTRTLTYINAGHNAPLIIGGFPPDSEAPQDRTVVALSSNGPAVGLLPDARYEQETISLAAGDLLLAFTDGVTEAVDAAGAEFGDERLAELARRHRDLPASGLRERILLELDRYRGETPQTDDITLVVVKAV
jgi:sigma-B regulation protein RsbU (phosphoserine phosphatase)